MHFIFIFVLVLLNTSCSILQSSKQPFWIDNPSTNTYIGSVAIVKNKSQKRLALIKARAYIVENIKSYLVSKATIKKNITNSKYSSSFTQEITQEAQGFIQDGFIKDSYVDKDGNYYIWFVVKKGNKVSMKYFLIVFVFIIFGCGNAKLSDYFGDGAISFSSNSKISANTNMQWQDNQRAKKYMNIRQAYRYCNTLSLDGYNDWFLPTFYEYENNDISFNNKLNNVWTSTSDESGDYSYFNGIKKSNNDRAYTRCARNIKSNLSKYSKPILKYKDVSTNTDYESLDFNIVYDSYKSVKIKSIYVYMKLGYKTNTKNVAINKIASSHGQKYISLDTKDIINRDGRYSVVVALKTTNYQTFDYRLYFNVSLTNKPPVARFRHKKNKNSISFFNTSFDDGDICTYKWNFDDGTTSRAKNPRHSFKESRYYNVSLIVKDCKGRYSKKFSKNIYIKVNKPPKASFDFIIKDTYYFKGIEVYNTSYDDKGICNYKWLINSKPVSFDAQPSFKFSENSSGYIELIVTDCEGLSDSDRQSYRLDVFKKK